MQTGQRRSGFVTDTIWVGKMQRVPGSTITSPGSRSGLSVDQNRSKNGR